MVSPRIPAGTPRVTPAGAARVGGRAQQFFSGLGLLLRGIGLYARSPRLMLLGLIPALISGIMFAGALALLLYFLADIASFLTPFADGWEEGLREVVQWIAALAVLGAAGLLGVLAFTAVTMVIGDPFYEKISKSVEARLGGVPNEVELPWYRSLRLSLVDSLRLVGLTVLVGLPLFALGFIPVLGQTVVPVIGALFGGWFLAVELTGVPFYRRGLRLANRRQALRAQRPMALGFGVGVFLCFLIPFGAVLIMPAAVAGAALLSRRALGLPID